ncbi:MAG TPA: hypothetical protein VJ783_21200, partial [Pirellulales bacterium]|nr:hypothetical protein [Pirellulales bacterium]
MPFLGLSSGISKAEQGPRSPYLERAFFSNRKKREVFGTWFKWLGWKLINVVVSLGSVVLGSAESG